MFGPDLKDLAIRADDPNKQEKEELHRDYEAFMGKKLTQLEQGNIWVGDASILWMPVPSLSHGVIWVSCPLLLKRWARISGLADAKIPTGYETNLEKDKHIYLKDAILSPYGTKGHPWGSSKDSWKGWQEFGLETEQTNSIKQVLVLPDALWFRKDLKSHP